MALAAGSCTGPLSTLDPAGPAAESIARLWWVMLVGAVAVMLLVLALLLLTFVRPSWVSRISGRAWIGWGGLALPITVLTALMVYAFASGERLLAHPGEPDVVEMEVVGRLWEWRFGPLGGELADDRLVIPAGRPVVVHITSQDVIHSFWVPRLAGKMDAIPGHVNRLRLVAPVPGVYRGTCAEFCGVGHTGMAFVVEAVDPEVYDAAAGEARR
jgi:cytochrome c oxidase subunit II